MNGMADEYWQKLHELYRDQDWIAKPSLFAEIVKDYLPTSGSLLDLGAGLGQDSVYFAELGHIVTATDIDVTHLQLIKQPELSVMRLDLREPLPFSDNSFDIVYAHLSLHYFDRQTTTHIFADIYRVLKPGGIVAFFTNSTDDPEYGTGEELEPDFFIIDGTAKRYLSQATAQNFARQFTPLLADNQGETYKDQRKDVHNLIRFIGKKEG